MKNLRVGIYINSRVQHPAVIENMVLMCKKRIFRLYHSVNIQYKIYKDKEAVPSRQGKGFMKMMDDVNNSAIEVIVTTNLGRLVQTAEDAFYFIRYLYGRKIRLICADACNFDSTSEEFRKYQYPFLQMLAELEYRNKSNQIYGSKKEDKDGREGCGNICQTRFKQ